jgi:thiaminase
MERNVVQAVKEIQSIQIERSHSLDDIYKEFFAICEKYNIKQGTQNYDEEGKETLKTFNSFEWTICKDSLSRAIQFELNFFDLLFDVPDNIKLYK